MTFARLAEYTANILLGPVWFLSFGVARYPDRSKSPMYRYIGACSLEGTCAQADSFSVVVCGVYTVGVSVNVCKSEVSPSPCGVHVWA